MNISRFRWTLDIVTHIARHGVAPIEVEELAFEDKVFVRTGRDQLHYLLGTTRSGRYLFVVASLTRRPGEALVVTARDMSKTEQSYYRKRGK